MQVTDALSEPFEDEHGAFLSDAWDKLLNLVLEEFGGRSEICLDLLRVQVDETDVGSSWKLSLEVLLVVLEQVQGVLERLNRVDKVNINKNIDVKLLVAPVDFEQILETGHEALSLSVRAVDELGDPISLCLGDFVL